MNINNIDKAKTLKDELIALNEIVSETFGAYNQKHTNHFEFLDRYGPNAKSVCIDRSLNKRIFDILKERIEELKQQIDQL